MSSCAHSTRAAAILAVAVVHLLLIPPAEAQRQRAQELAQQARDHFVAGEYVEALELFEQAFELDPHPVILFNEARCLEELGDLPRALERFRLVLDFNPPEGVVEETEAKITEIEALLVQQGYELDQLDPETYVAVASLSVTSLPSGAEVAIDGEPVGVTPVEDLFLAPGTYQLSVAMPGYQTHVRTLEIEPGRNISVHAGLRRDEAVTSYQPPEPGFLELTGPRRGMEVYLDDDLIGRTPLSGTAIPPGRYRLRVHHDEFEDWTEPTVIVSGETTRVYADAQRREDLEGEGMTASDWGLVTVISGGAILATGVVFGVLAKADADRYAENVDAPERGDIREDAQRSALIADIAFLTGGVLVATSVVLYVLGGRETGEEGERPDELVQFQLGPTPTGWAVGLSGRF